MTTIANLRATPQRSCGIASDQYRIPQLRCGVAREPLARVDRHGFCERSSIMRNSTRSETHLPGALVAGAAGAAAVTATNELVRQITPRAPRLDELGKRGLARTMRAAGARPPKGRKLYWSAMAGDLALNTLYYALAGTGRRAVARGGMLGALAGAGAVVLPPLLGLGLAPRGLTPRTKAMTFAYYLLGGLVAGAVGRSLGRRRR
jgi:hypothetical protein